MTDRTFHFIISSLNCEFEGRIARGKRNEIFYSEEAALYNKNIVLETLLLNDDTKITAANKNLEEQLYKSDIYAGSRYEKEYLLFQLGCKKYRIITIFTR